MPEQKKTDSDLFVTRSIYPDPESVFTARYKSLEQIKESCYIVLDTNTLLVPYATSKDSLEQIRETYKALIGQGRLVIPAQVAREFAKNRASKIGELFQQLSQKRNNSEHIQTGTYPLLESHKEYQKSLELERQINDLTDNYRETVGKVLDHVRGWIWDDSVSVLYGELFAKGVVREAAIDDDGMKEDLERRNLHKIPPGFKDSGKDDRGVGDLIIWQTILDVGRTTKKSVIFVSQEEKSDWWHRSNNQPLYPRYELLDEFRRASEGATFHIVRFSKFLDLFGASKPVVNEIKEKEIGVSGYSGVEVRPSQNQFLNLKARAQLAIAQWLTNIFPDFTVKQGRDVPLIMTTADGGLLWLVEIEVFMDPRNFARRWRELQMRLEAPYFVLILVGGDNSASAMLAVDANDKKLTSGATVVVGHLGEDNEFIPIYSNDAAFNRS